MIYLNPPLEVSRRRDPSGLYAAAELSGSLDLPGVSFPYDEPENPDLVLDTEAHSVEQCLTQVIRLMKTRNII
jgi:bifunctional enzyme CysN/CysC